MLSTIDIAIVLSFLAYCVATGFRHRARSSRNLEEYFLAARTLPGWKAGISMAATQFAADTPLLVTGMVATAGIFSLWRLWIYALAFLLLGLVLAGPWRRAGVLTDAELAELRYGGRAATVLRGVKAIYFGTIFNCTVLAMVLFAAARIAEPFLLWQEWLPGGLFARITGFVDWSGLSLGGPTATAAQSASNLLSLLAVVGATAFYSTTGGLRAVVNTDVVQFAIAIVATALYAWFLVDDTGGLSALPERLRQLYGEDWTRATLAFTPGVARDAGPLVLAVIGVQWLAQMNADGTGYLAQRTMACRSDRDARQAAMVFVAAQILLRSLLWLPIAVGLLILFPLGSGAGPELAAAREGTFVDGIAASLPAGARGLMLTGLLAALASTIDTHFNWGASYWTNDLFRRIVCELWLRREPSSRVLVRVARLSNLVILSLALLILTRLSSIQTAWQTSLLLGAGMGIPLVLRWLWWRMSALAEIAGIVMSSLLAPLALLTIADESLRLLVVAGGSAAAAVLVAWMRPEHSSTLSEFYRRARPPGWWRPVAELCGDEPGRPLRQLTRGGFAMIGWTFATFCVLVGAGSWLVGSPSPTDLAGATTWSVGLIALGLAIAVLLGRRLHATPS